MTTPNQLLAEALQGALDAQAVVEGGPEPVKANVYPEPPPSGAVAVPALVVRADNPWMRPADSQQPFGRIGERYVVVAVVQAGGDALDALRRLVMLADSIEGGWRWTETGGIIQAKEGDITYLTATVRLTYSRRD